MKPIRGNAPNFVRQTAATTSKGPRGNKSIEFAPSLGSDLVGPEGAKPQSYPGFGEDFVTEDRPKMATRWDAKRVTYSYAGPKTLEAPKRQPRHVPVDHQPKKTRTTTDVPNLHIGATLAAGRMEATAAYCRSSNNLTTALGGGGRAAALLYLVERVFAARSNDAYRALELCFHERGYFSDDHTRRHIPGLGPERPYLTPANLGNENYDQHDFQKAGRDRLGCWLVGDDSLGFFLWSTYKAATVKYCLKSVEVVTVDACRHDETNLDLMQVGDSPVALRVHWSARIQVAAGTFEVTAAYSDITFARARAKTGGLRIYSWVDWYKQSDDPGLPQAVAAKVESTIAGIFPRLEPWGNWLARPIYSMVARFFATPEVLPHDVSNSLEGKSRRTVSEKQAA